MHERPESADHRSEDPCPDRDHIRPHIRVQGVARNRSPPNNCTTGNAVQHGDERYVAQQREGGFRHGIFIGCR